MDKHLFQLPRSACVREALLMVQLMAVRPGEAEGLGHSHSSSQRRFGAKAGEVWPFLPDPLRRTLLASLRQDAAAQRQAQEGNVQGQEGAEAGHAGGPAADHHGGAAHAGRGRAADRGVRVRGHAPRHHRMSAAGLPQQAAEAREGEGKRKMAFVFRDFPNAEL
ncbi:single-pass membrane and coiled-coil domain-containing protein 4 [Canis lupus familiaris]|uniref:single-pass membrane and coiled-coil domain-containing protein 4 n=1 Tax=Canis lupus familiaris TaxID=9615 RepID=UPI0018F4490F|nr:single-pass membrane and coiled-coil domain-containing protein 4 [Canis lupus familiaris]